MSTTERIVFGIRNQVAVMYRINHQFIQTSQVVHSELLANRLCVTDFKQLCLDSTILTKFSFLILWEKSPFMI